MWKLIVGFVVFAAIAMFVIIKGGDKLDMGGEKHGEDPTHAPAAAKPAAPSPAPAVSAPAAAAEPAGSAASAPAAPASGAAKP
jgi:hypothetical protein